MDIEDKLRSLENESRKLEPAADARSALFDDVKNFVNFFLERLEGENAFKPDTSSKEAIEEFRPQEKPFPLQKVLGAFKDEVVKPGLQAASGGHLGYIPGGGVVAASMGDVLAAVTNLYAGVYFASPGAVRLENMLLKWLAGLFGYPETAAGNLTSGGSIANLSAIVAARDAKNIRSVDVPKAVVYLSPQTHHSVDKALRIAGLGETVQRHLQLDDDFRIEPDFLRHQIQKDIAAGLQPFLLIGNAGTTDTGAVDPIHALADVAEEFNLWLHIDAAYGGGFILTEEGKKKLSGIERSHSLVMDPHKGFFLPYGSGAVLVRDAKHLAQSHHYTANYMQDTLSARDEISPADVSPELTKHFRGMRLWLPFMLHGIAPFRACLQEKLLLCELFYDEVQKIKGIEVGPKPQLSVALFRYVPETGDANLFNQKLVKAIQQDGRVFLSSTTINGTFWIRIAILSFRTHLSTVQLALKVVRESVVKVEE